MINYYELVINNPAYFKQFSCKEVLFLNYDCPVKVRKLAKWSQHHYVYYVISGKKALHTSGGTYHFTTGSLAFIKKGACIIEQFFDDPFCIVVFIIPDSYICSFLDDYLPGEKPTDISEQPIIPLSDDNSTKAFYQSVIPYFAGTAELPEEIVELKFKELLLHLLNNQDNSELKNYLLTLRNEKDSPINKIMEANYAYNLNIDAYARLTNRSVSSFKRDFQAIYKTTPGRWLIEKKLNHARALLLQSGKTIADIAFESGFENNAHFSRLFRQKTGITPMQYRKQISRKEEVAV